MLKLSLLGHSGIKDEIIGEIHKAGIVQISEIDREEMKKFHNSDDEGGSIREFRVIDEKLQEIGKIKEGLDFSIKFLTKYKPRKKLLDSLSSDQFIFENDSYIKTAEGFDHGICEQVKIFSNRITELESIYSNTISRIEVLEPWKGLQINISDVYNASPQVDALFAYIDIKSFKEFRETVDTMDFVHLSIIHSEEEIQYFSILYLKEKSDKIQELLKRFSLIQMDFSDIKENIASTIREFESKEKEIQKELKDIDSELKRIARDHDTMLISLDYWTSLYKKEEIKKKFLGTRSSFLLKGWIRKNDLDNLNAIKKRFKEVDIALEPPSKKDEPPVALENNPFNSPFEVVTKLFGLPTKKEVDPTPLFAPFFALFFGICLTDAGYGLVLIILSLFMLRNKYLGTGSRNLLRLIAISGVFTMIVGALAGGFFGIQFENLPASFQAVTRFKEKLAVLDPLKNPLRLFGFAIGLGVFQIITGFIIKFILLLKNREFRSAVVEALSWLLIIHGILLAVLLKVKYFWGLAILGAGIIVLFTSKSKNPLARIGAGLFGLYDITGIFGDIVSYSRLFALALATGVVAMVINIIVGIIYGMVVNIPVIGVPLAVIVLVFILVFGHLFNIGINALGAFVHTTRLQFVEYFTKFYQSGGKEFSPFKEDLDYVRIKKT